MNYNFMYKVIYKSIVNSNFLFLQQYGVVEEGVVYLGDVEVIVELNNGPIICSDVTDADTSCTVTLPRDIYNISITQSNDIGSTVDSASFDSECFLLLSFINPS